MSQVIRALKTAGKSQIEQSVYKATYDDESPPKPKHLKILIEASQPGTYVDVVGLLMKRFQSKTWTEVLKSLIVIHHLTVDARVGGQAVLEDLGRKGNLALLVPTCPAETAEAKQLTALIKPYAEYLTDKVGTFTTLKRSCEREPPFDDAKWPTTLSTTGLVDAILAFVKQLDSGFEISLPQWGGQVNPIAARVGDLILKDTLRLHSALGHCFTSILEKKSELTRIQAEQLSEAATKGIKYNDLIRTRVSEYLQLGVRKSLPAIKFIGADVALELKTLSRTLRGGSSVSDRERGGSSPRGKDKPPKSSPVKGTSVEPVIEEKKKPKVTPLNLGTTTRERSGTSKSPGLDRVKSSPDYFESDNSSEQPPLPRATSSPLTPDSGEAASPGSEKKKKKSKKQAPSSPFSIKAPPDQSISRNRGTSVVTSRPDSLQVMGHNPKTAKSAPTSPQDDDKNVTFPKSTSGVSPASSLDIFDTLSFDAFASAPTSAPASTRKLEEPSMASAPTRNRRGSVDHFTILLNRSASGSGSQQQQQQPQQQPQQQVDEFSIF